MNGEEHLLMTKYKDLLLKSGNLILDDTFLMIPGFRYSRNGDIKGHWSLNKALTRRRGNSSSNPSSKKSSKNALSIGTKEKEGSQKEESKAAAQVDLGKQIEELEKELQEIRSNMELRDISDRLRDTGRSLTFLRAHSKDPAPLSLTHVLSSPVRSHSFARKAAAFHGGTYGQKLVKAVSINPTGKRALLAERLGRQVTKDNCVACEFRLRIRDEPNSSRQKSTQIIACPWKLAPSGKYVRKLEQPSSSPNLTPRAARTASEYNQNSGRAVDVSTTTSSPACFAVTKRPTAKSYGCGLRGQVFKIAALQAAGSDPCCSGRTRHRPSDCGPSSVHGHRRGDSQANLSDGSMPLTKDRTESGQTSRTRINQYSAESAYHLVLGRSGITSKKNLQLLAQLSTGPVGLSVVSSTSDQHRPRSRQTVRPRQSLLRPSSKDITERIVCTAAFKARMVGVTYTCYLKIYIIIQCIYRVISCSHNIINGRNEAYLQYNTIQYNTIQYNTILKTSI